MISNQKGQSLVEVLITVLIIAVSVVALIRFQSYLSYDSSLVKQKSDASALAQQQLETLMDFQTISTTPGYTSYESISSGSSTSTINGTAYAVTWTVNSFTFPTYKTLSVNVSWSDRYGGAQSLTIDSNVAGIEPGFSAIIY